MALTQRFTGMLLLAASSFSFVFFTLAALVVPALGLSPGQHPSLLSLFPEQMDVVLVPVLIFATVISGLLVFIGITLADDSSPPSSSKNALWPSDLGPGDGRDIQHPTTKSSSGADVADFSGRWVLSEIEGDVDTFMRDMGDSAAFRRRARSANYAVGEQIHEIRQEGDRFQCQCAFTGHATHYTVGGGVQEATEMSKAQGICVIPSWSDGGMSLLYLGWYEDDERAIPRSKRFFQNGHMIAVLASPQGTVIRRVYTRQETVPGVLNAELPDFSGWWVQTGYGGDADAHMKDVGKGWAFRQLAFAVNCGSGRNKCLIRHSDGNLAQRFAGDTGFIDIVFKPGCEHSARWMKQKVYLHGSSAWMPDGSLRFSGTDPDGCTRSLGFRKLGPDSFELAASSPNKHIMTFTFKLVRPLMTRDVSAVVGVDFSGEWRLEDIRNKERYEEVLAWHGATPPERFLARRNNFKIGRFSMGVVQDGDVLLMSFPSGPGGLSYIRADGQKYDGFDFWSCRLADAVSMKFDPQGLRLHERVWRKDGQFVDTVMELVDGKLVWTRPFPDGGCVQRIHVRRTPEDAMDPRNAW